MLQFNHPPHSIRVSHSLFASTASYEDDWPQFRGPGGQGISKAENLPVTWSEMENIAWKTALPESGRVRDHGYAAATPATDGKLILRSDENLYAIAKM